MEGHGEKFTRKQEVAIIALLTAPNIAAAAKQADIGEATLGRWLQDEQFKKRFREAKQDALSQAIGQLQQATGEAVKTLREVAISEDAPASSRVTAAKSILELALKARETEELEERIEELETLVNNKLGGNEICR